LADDGHLLRVWKRSIVGRGTVVVGLYSARDEAQLTGLLQALPLFEWMQIDVTPLEPHPNDPAASRNSIVGEIGSRS
jgi:muconolactone delta-isomerase